MAEEKYWFNVTIGSRYDVAYNHTKTFIQEYDPTGYWHIWFFGSFSEFKKYLESEIDEQIFSPIIKKHAGSLIGAKCTSSWLSDFNILSMAGGRATMDNSSSNLFIQMVVDFIKKTISSTANSVHTRIL